jgi:hypothetical protein
MSHTQNFNTYNVPKPPFEVPPLSCIYQEYLNACPDKTLRFGQWFYNRFIGSTRSSDMQAKIDELHAAKKDEDAMWIIINMYKDYQWPQ